VELASRRVRAAKERELKLTASEGSKLVEDLGEPIETRVFTSTYYDTPDRALAAVGVTLRRRLENGKNLWQLKLPGRGFRTEVELQGGPGRPPRQLRESLLALARGQKLEETARLKTRRSGVHVRDAGRDVAEVVVDSVSVLDNGRVDSTFNEIEVESLDGDRKALKRLAKELQRRGASATDGRPKVFRALGLVPREPADPGADAPAHSHLAAYVAGQRNELLAHDPGARLASDPEDVHRMRVAARRARSVLATARPILDKEVSEPLRAELKWLGSALGPVRDLDVLVDYMRVEMEVLPADDRFAAERLVQVLATERDVAHAQLVEALESERYLALLDSLAELALEPPLNGRKKGVSSLAAREFRKLRDVVAALPREPSDAELHRIRVRAKRARYAGELAEGAVGKKATRFITRAKRLQDVIGEHQDAVVARERIEQALGVSRGARVAFAAGRLVEREDARRRRARTAWPRAWRKLEQSGRSAWL
jgi:CHAD domain-containing protein